MKVFVIIVTYNGIKWIEQCLNSVLNNSFTVDVIVIDNGSTDGTPEFIELNFNQVILLKQNENIGFGGANNIGIKKAYKEGADYVFLLNQDAWVEPDTIVKLIKAQQNEPHFGIISPMHLNGSGDVLDYNFSNYIMPSKCENLYSDIYLNKIKNSIYQVDFVNAAAWLISKKCIETVGGFSSSFFHYGEDDNYTHRVKFHNFKIGILPSTRLFHDREQRKTNVYFQNSDAIYKREIILKASNPFSEFSFFSEYKKRFKNLFKAFCKFQFKEVKQINKQIRILSDLNKKAIVKARNESKLTKPSFLD
ncbi:Glycosyltransferase, GT2 family [Flavobacterium glycines]|uniref:Glycosyltransferase, GT2 family n=1 Tax=Flavobacterium glycines TaxID=551990 RepID=A0A1B9DHB4_9FLAO|nr:glycosyltransferase family 2 protein [Flavobacterium glycines]OCB69060.1 hypothetical protein FBGL_13570 [Flavobacterium glycines]GEL12390.1 hypothetical protein FGL01_31290 [Flavobacterium glycines]SDJ53130.1 Glycosyltransferase, GT2 family [Flavobacterium glycines]